MSKSRGPEFSYFYLLRQEINRSVQRGVLGVPKDEDPREYRANLLRASANALLRDEVSVAVFTHHNGTSRWQTLIAGICGRSLRVDPESPALTHELEIDSRSGRRAMIRISPSERIAEEAIDIDPLIAAGTPKAAGYTAILGSCGPVKFQLQNTNWFEGIIVPLAVKTD